MKKTRTSVPVLPFELRPLSSARKVLEITNSDWEKMEKRGREEEKFRNFPKKKDHHKRKHGK
jgi:hypothetical protein